MVDTNFQVGYSKFSKVFIILVFSMLLIGLIIVVPEWYSESDYGGLLVYGLPLLIFIVIAVISLIRYQLEIADSYVELTDIRTRRIYFAAIRSIEIHEDWALLKSDDIEIKVSTSISNRKQVLDEIISRVRNLPTVRIDGEEKVIEKYFGKMGK